MKFLVLHTNLQGCKCHDLLFSTINFFCLNRPLGLFINLINSHLINLCQNKMNLSSK